MQKVCICRSLSLLAALLVAGCGIFGGEKEVDPTKDWSVSKLYSEARALLNERKPGRRLYTNVEFYSAAVLAAVGLPGDMFTPTFAVARSVGWSAHVLEQVANNRLIRPQSEFVGELGKTYVPVEAR